MCLNIFIKHDFIEIYSKTQQIAPNYNNITLRQTL